MQGRQLVERASLFFFVAGLAITVMVFISRNNSSEAPVKATAAQQQERSSEALGLQTGPRGVAPVATISGMTHAAVKLYGLSAHLTRVFKPEPTLAEVLVAADQVQRAQDYYRAIGAAPTPTMAEVLVAADQVRRAQDYYRAIGAVPSPTVAEILVAADQVTRAQDYFEALSVPVTPAPPSTPVPQAPAPTNTPAPPPPAPTNTPVPPPPPLAPPTSTPEPVVQAGNGWWDAAFEAEVFAVINQKRAEAGLAPLAVESRLTQAGKAYAKVLADYNHFSHTGPDGSTLVSRVEAAGFPFTVQIGEVIAWGSNGWPPVDIVQAWMDSPSHREQIMSPVYTQAGVGCYFTEEAGLTVRCVVDLAGS